MPALNVSQLNVVLAIMGAKSAQFALDQQLIMSFLILGAFIFLYGLISVKMRMKYYLGEACMYTFQRYVDRNSPVMLTMIVPAVVFGAILGPIAAKFHTIAPEQQNHIAGEYAALSSYNSLRSLITSLQGPHSCHYQCPTRYRWGSTSVKVSKREMARNDSLYASYHDHNVALHCSMHLSHHPKHHFYEAHYSQAHTPTNRMYSSPLWLLDHA